MRFEDDSALNAYFREISGIRLLSAGEEIALAHRIQARDEEARSLMVLSNLRLVVKIAKDYAGRGLGISDLISEGNLGLIEAVDRFDPLRGAKFSTYGSWWIKQAIQRAVSGQGRTVRIPSHQLEKLSRIRRIESSLRQHVGRDPTLQEMACELGLSEGKLRQLRQLAVIPVSFDEPSGRREGLPLAETIPAESVELSDLIVDSELQDHLAQTLEILSERERLIIDHRFGLRGAKQMHLEEIGTILGISRERVRQIQNIALKKMKKVLGRKV